MKGPTHYRYYTSISPNGVTLHCEQFQVVRETRSCYYIFASHWGSPTIWGEDFVKRHSKRVLKDSRKRFAYPDRRQALESFIQRQRHRLSHAKASTSQAELGSAAANHMLDSDQLDVGLLGRNCGVDDYIQSIGWYEG